MPTRKILKIAEELCNGCGRCIPNCPEGALQIIDGKVRLVSDLFCDGLGACIGHCPTNAITLEEREAQPYDEAQVMANIIRQGPNVIAAHLQHLQEHGQQEFLTQALAVLKAHGIAIPGQMPGDKPDIHDHSHSHGCPGSRMMDFRQGQPSATPISEPAKATTRGQSELRQWPVQLKLVPPFAPYLNNAHLLVAADCVPFAYANFHEDFLKGKVLLIGCPKLDDLDFYLDKMVQVLEHNQLKSITYVRMEVPCCAGLGGVIQEALAATGKEVPYQEIVVSVRGEKMQGTGW